MNYRKQIRNARAISILILILFGMFSVDAFAEREAKTTDEHKLLEAVRSNSLSEVNKLIKAGVSVKITDIYGQSLLMFAAQKNNKELVKLLIKKGADPNYVILPPSSSNDERNGIRMLFLVRKKVLDFGVETSDTTMVDLLIQLGVKLDIKNKEVGSTVANASRDNNVPMVRYLLKKGAKVSDETGQFLVVWHISKIATIPVYDRTSSDQNTDFRIIKIWDDYGIPLDDEALVKSQLLKSGRERDNIRNYMAVYREWVANGAVESIQRGRNKFVELIPQASDEERFDSLAKNVEAKTASEDILKDQKQLNDKDARIKEWISLFSLICILIACVVFRNQILFYSKYLYRKFKLTTFYKYLFLRGNNQTQVQSQNNKAVVDKQKGNQPKVFSEKGWSTDDTVMLEVNYLTVEDIINPIRMVNQHERNVREMIWYIRKMERISRENPSKTIISTKEVYETLYHSWKQIDAKQVRSVYKRSLLIILENYSKQYPKAKKLIKKIK